MVRDNEEKQKIIANKFNELVRHSGVKEKKWYQKLSFGGYAQVRYNRLLETNEKLKCDQCDKSIGEGQGLFARRARLKLSGDLHERLYMYIQVDVATNATSGSTTGLNYLQLRENGK